MKLKLNFRAKGSRQFYFLFFFFTHHTITSKESTYVNYMQVPFAFVKSVIKFDRMQNVSIGHVCICICVHVFAWKVDATYKRVIVPILFLRGTIHQSTYIRREFTRGKKKLQEETCKKFAIDLSHPCDRLELYAPRGAF